MNLVIHEFAHKLDMRNGDANGCPPLPRSRRPHVWKATITAAYEHFSARVDRDEARRSIRTRPRVPAEFFAVLSEVFFASPATLVAEYPEVYRQLAAFFRQEPAARA